MMKPAEDRIWRDGSDPLNRAKGRRIFIQWPVRSDVVVIAGIGPQDLAQMPLGQKIETVERIFRRSFVRRCAAIWLMQQRIADFSIFVLSYFELRAQKQAQLKIGPFEPQPSGSQN
jgi:hypothetical protein